MSEERPALQVDHLAKTYVLGFFRKKVRAITDVSFKVTRGEIFGLLGPNGAGKTTTLKILMGLIRPNTGKAELWGAPIGDVGAKRQLGYLPESPYFYEYLTGRELVVFMGKLFGLSQSEARQRAATLLEQVGLAGAADLALRRYSKGMLQRAGLAQALVNDPQLLILDEPMTGLDPIGRKDVRELIARLRDQGKTIIFSSHIISDVELLADRVAILVKGKTVDTGPLHQLLDAEILYTEVAVDSVSDALVAALKETNHAVTQKPEGLVVTVQEQGQVQAVLDLVHQHQGRVYSVTPRRQSLEDVVVKQAQAQQS